MDAVTTISVTITPEAAEHAAALGVQAELDQMVEQLRKAVPGILRLNVVLEPPYETGGEDVVLIEVTRDESYAEKDDRALDQFRTWRIEAFSPHVLSNISLLVQYGSSHAR